MSTHFGWMERVLDRSISLALGDRMARWSRLSMEFAVSQGLAQAAGMVCGLIYVRVMPIDQYALYAIGLSALTFVSIGSDLGLTAALGYFWRQKLKGGSTFEPRLAAARTLMSVFLVLASIVCGCLLLKTADKQNLPMTSVFACFALVVATAWSQTRTNVGLMLV